MNKKFVLICKYIHTKNVIPLFTSLNLLYSKLKSDKIRRATGHRKPVNENGCAPQHLGSLCEKSESASSVPAVPGSPGTLPAGATKLSSRTMGSEQQLAHLPGLHRPSIYLRAFSGHNTSLSWVPSQESSVITHCTWAS